MRKSILLSSPGLIICLMLGCGGGVDAPQSTVPEESTSVSVEESAPAAVDVATKEFDPKGKGKDAGMKPASQPAVSTTPSNEGQSSLENAGNLLAAAVGVLADVHSPSTLPENTVQWTPAHFELAVRRRNSNLPDAINFRASQGPPEVFVALMKRLLDVAMEPASLPNVQSRESLARNAKQATAMSDDGGPFRLRFRDDDDDDRRGGGKGRGRDDRKASPVKMTPQAPQILPSKGDGQLTIEALTRGVVAGLLTRDSEESWNALKAILDGTQQTPLDPMQSAIAVFEGMLRAQNVSPVMIESVAVSVVNSPGTNRTGQTILASFGTRALRDELHLPADKVDPAAKVSGPAAVGQRLIRFGRKSRKGPEEEEEADRRKSPPPAKTLKSKLPPVRVPPGSMNNLITAIRGQELQQAVTEKLGATAIAAGDLSLLRFASTIPGVRLRQAIFELYQVQYPFGATPIINSGLFETGPIDPGHLVILKSLPRSASQVSIQTPATRRGRDSDISPVAAAVGPEESWTEATWLLANALRQQLRQVANDPELALNDQGPIRLHRGGEAEVAIQISIEDGSNGSEVPPVNTQVFYSRCRVDALRPPEMRQISKHYESRTKGVRRERPGDGVLWFDGVRKGRDGTRTSMDVMIERSTASTVDGFGGAAGRRDDRRSSGAGGAGYTIEAIAVVITDPQVSISTADNRGGSSNSR